MTLGNKQMAKRALLLLWLVVTFVAGSAGQSQSSKTPVVRPPDDEESGESIREREEFFTTRRAGGPGKKIPEGAYERAASQHRALTKERRLSGVDAVLPAWKSVNPSGLFYYVTNGNYISGRTNSIAWDPSDPTVIYIAAAGGGVWKSTDDGISWKPLTDELSSLACGAIAADPGDPNVLYLGTGELNYSLDSYYGDGLFKSTDAGESWFKLFDTYIGRYFSQIIVDPMNTSVVYTASNQNVFKSTNGGTGWANTACGSYVNALVINPSNTQILYASVGGTGTNTIRKTTDGGNSWTTLGGGLPTTNMGRTSLAISSSNPLVLYASISHRLNDGLLGVYRTTNGGTTWTLQANSPNYLGSQGWYDNAVAVDPLDENTVVVGGLDVYVSYDGGITLEQKSSWFSGTSSNFTHADVHFLGYSNGRLYCGSDGGVYRSEDNGESWIDLNAGLSTLQFQSADYDATDPLKMVGGTQDNNIENTVDGGVTWSQYTTGDGGYTVIDPVTPDFVYSQYVNGSVERSDNGGIGFIEISPNGASGGLFYNPYELAPGNHNVMVFAQSDVWKSTSVQTATTLSGWTQISGSVGSAVSAIGISHTDVDKIYIGTSNGRVLVTTNNGVQWTTALNGSLYVTDLAVDPENDSICYATFGGFSGSTHVYKTTNNGTTWGNITSNLPNIPVNSIVIRSVLPRMLMLGTDLGVYLSKNDGGSWSAFNNGLPTVAVFDLKYKDPNKLLLAATHGRGCFTYDFSGFSFGIVPTTLAFGNVLLNTSAVDTITVTNTGTSTISVTAVSSDNAQFTVQPTSASIPASGSLKFAVTYHPVTEGGYSATVTFTHSGMTSPDVATVTGYGSLPKFTSGVSSVNFGTLLLGMSRDDSVFVFNTGSLPLHISSILSTNLDFSAAPTGGDIPAGGSMKFTLTYFASSLGVSTGNLVFNHNAGTTRDTVKVSGRGGVATAQMIILEDADGNPATTGDRTPKKWHCTVYENTISPGTIVGSGDSARVTVFVPTAGTYILSQADSGLSWSRLNAGGQRNDTISLGIGGMKVDTFIVRRYAASITAIDKWNMLSMPLMVQDSSYTTLFPEAISSPFKWASLYQFSQYMYPGIGYWLKFIGAHSYTFSGSPVDSLTINARLGWNLIGTTAVPVPVSAIVQIPPGIVLTPFYRYSGVYSITDTLVPGNAYWVKTSQTGQLILGSGSALLPTAGVNVSTPGGRSLGTLRIADATGIAQPLYIGERQETSHLSGEIPPQAPETALNVRFASNALVELYDPESDNIFPISIASAAFPLTVTWTDDAGLGISPRLTWTLQGKRSERTFAGVRSVIVPDSAATEIVLEIKGRLPLPKKFSLEQNYPNPFNPSTSIRYSLPSDARVTLKLYNILGQEVMSLVDEYQSAGYKRVTVNGDRLASGVYLYTLEAGFFSETRKMVLIR